jgi:hypothetical protein
MLNVLRSFPVGHDRVIRLFAVHCCRAYHIFSNPKSRAGVEASERFADGQITRDEMLATRDDAWAVATGSDDPGSWRAALAALIPAAVGETLDAEFECQVLRDLVGPLLFRPVQYSPWWLSWADGTVAKLAHQIYAEKDFASLPVLADALTEAGCDDPDILSHCRQPGEHVLGCWVVDLLLGKS